jgi:hypothetical protein
MIIFNFLLFYFTLGIITFLICLTLMFSSNLEKTFNFKEYIILIFLYPLIISHIINGKYS